MKKQSPKASVLAFSLIILGVMIIIALGISFSSLQARKSSIGSSKSSVAFQAADSGVEAVLQKIKNIPPGGSVGDIFPDGRGTCTDGIYEVPGKYKIELKNSTEEVINDCGSPISSIVKVKSTGYHGQDSRAIEASVNP